MQMKKSASLQTLSSFISKNKTQYLILLFFLVVVNGITASLNASNSSIFQKYLGNLNPLMVISAISVLGILLLSFLLLKNWLIFNEKKKTKELSYYFLLMVVFLSTAIFVDIMIVFPKSMNIEFPDSLLFYPSIGFLVEILFHVLPLFVLLLFFSLFLKGINHRKTIWICLLIVATIEPTYQAIFMHASPSWAIIVIWINLLFFNLTQLVIYKKYDFISMYLFRLIYYGFWHIGWGYVRLNLIF